MLCICSGFNRPNRVLKQGVRVLIVVQKQHNFSRHYIKLFCNPSSNFAKVFSGISLSENGFRLLCVGSLRFVS